MAAPEVTVEQEVHDLAAPKVTVGEEVHDLFLQVELPAEGELVPVDSGISFGTMEHTLQQITGVPAPDHEWVLLPVEAVFQFSRS